MVLPVAVASELPPAAPGTAAARCPSLAGAPGAGCVETEGDSAVMLQRVTVGSDTKVDRAQARVVFYAGLEGSGHHLLEALFPKLQKQLSLKAWVDENTIIPGIGCFSTEYDKTHFAALRARFAELDPHSVYTLPQALSYPHCIADHTARRDELHPRASFLAQAADVAAVDFQVIFLYRPVIESLVAGCINRNFEKCLPYVETLLKNTEFLLQDVKLVGKSRVYCFKYGDMESMVSAVDAAYGPNVHSRSDMESTYHAKHSNTTDDMWASMEKTLGSAAIQQLRAADARLQQVCRELA